MRILRHRFGYLTQLVDVIPMLLLLCIPRTETFNCEDKSIGVESKGIIPDSSFNASSCYNYPYQARLPDKYNGWQPKDPHTDPDQYLQIDLGFEYFICAIATKAGKSRILQGSNYVKTYKITMSLDQVKWTSYQEDGQTRVFTGNKDSSSVVKQTLKHKSLMRYIRVYPIKYNRYKAIKVALYGYAKFEVCITNPLGMESGSIPDNHISASSSQHSTLATNARLKSSSSWCPTSSDQDPHLQVDLGSDYVICAIATQGNNAADQWATSYYMSLSSDGNSWKRYKEKNSSARIFYGNYDRSTVIKQVLYESTSTRYVRIEPETYHGTPCLRIEIYGYQLQSTCIRNSVGVPSPFIVPDHRFTASSSYSGYKPSLARLDESYSWLTSKNPNEFLQIDLNQIFRICSVLTQGDSSDSSWVIWYKIKFSRDNRQWDMYRELDGIDEEFKGNIDKATIVANSIKYPFKAKFVRLLPISANRYIALRVDFKGTAEACTFAFGLENEEISDSRITSSSSLDISHGAARARLYGSSSWCSSSVSNTEYIQVDLGQVKTVTGVALQGDPWRNKWVTKFILSYGFSSGAWYYYKEGQVTKLFTGNSNRYDVIVKWLRRPIAARYVRILPRGSIGGRCLRFDLYGCDYVVTPIVTINTKQITVPSTKGRFQTLTCSLTGPPTPKVQWFHNGIKITGASRPSYKVKFNSADDVVKNYSCTRPNPNRRAVICKTNVTCRAIYPAQVPSAQPAEQSAEATVNLNVPKSPEISLSPQKRSLGVSWSSVVSDDEGRITWYFFEFRNITGWKSFKDQPPKLSGVLKYLKPYTNYDIKMRAASAVGVGLWSSIKTVQTLIAEPEGRPVLYATAESSTSIKISWTFSADDKLNGPLHGFRITYADQDGTKLFKNVGNIRATVLAKLKKYTRYAITISVGNTLYYGPESSIVNQLTKEDAPECAPRLKTVQALTSTSIRVTWDPLPDTTCRNGVLKGYKISYHETGDSKWKSADVGDKQHSKDLIYLNKYTTYLFIVIGYTIKDGPASNAVSETTLQDAPSSPTIKEVMLLHPQGSIRVPRVRITWDKPFDENGVITRYILQYHYDNDNWMRLNITDTLSLTHTIEVLGEARFWCRMSASTIKEGPYSVNRQKLIPAYAPSIAPRNIRVSKINETRFTVLWQPLTRKEANGILTEYKISWTLKHIGRTKRMTSVGEAFSKTIQGSQFVLSSLRLCAEYNVQVAGLTSAGAGPNATSTIVTSKPGEPINLRSVEEGQTFINLQWEKPRGITEDVKSYQIYLEGSKPTYWTSYNDSKKESRDGSKTTLKIDNLQPGTRYDIWVIASTVCGESNKSSLATASTNIAKPKTPQGTVVTLKDSLNVTLWEVRPYNGPLSSYQVIVITNENQNLTELPETLNNYDNSKKKDQRFYITAEIAPDQLKDSKVFIIGDDKMYGIYKNVPLQKGGTYTIAERAITSHGGKRYSSDIVHVATIRLSPEPTKNAKSTSSSSVVGVTVGIVIALLVVIIVLALVGFKYKRNRDRKNEESSPMPLNDITSEPDGGNECESYLMTDDNDIPTRAQLSNEDRPQYVNVGLSANAAINDDGIYENPKDSISTALTKRQFLELVKSCRATDYAQLKDEFKGLLNTHVYPVEIAKRPINKKKNRYANIVTYDHSRVLISPQPGDKNSDYVNASYIKGYDGTPKTYIATQGPNPVTVPDFWQMVWEQNTCTIVMLTNLTEGSKAKCYQYWPDSSETHRDFTVKAHKTEVFPDYIVRTFLLSKTNTNESRQINHFQFIVWPDKGVPQYSTAVLGLRRHVRKSNPDHAGPVVVHCSAGVGRTGAYIVIDAMLDRAKNLKNVDISNYVTCIRTDRPYMVQTDEQYVFIHLALYETFTCGNTEIQVHNLQITMNKLSSMNEQKNSTGYALEFERLKRVTEEYSQEKCDVGKLPVNIDKNRYKDKIALNRSRVLLSKPGETVSSNYINASHVDAYTQRNAFLVTQAPFEKTVEDFWIMIANYEVKTIVMLNALQEENEQFTQYWPESGTTVYGHVSVELKDTRSVGILTCRRLEVTYDTTAVQVQHIQMPNWVDKCCPENEQIVLDLLNEVEQSQRQTTSSPVVVHCSDGIGRSGTFCAAYSIIERAKQEQTIDIFQSVKQIRVNRPGAVEKLTQYVFCYQIIQRYIDSFSDYANFEN